MLLLRIIMNVLFITIFWDPQTGMVTYFLPLLSGSHKVYSTKENSFWCCVGSGFENHAKYGEAIYYHNDKGIYVNLFIPSVVNWQEKGLTLRQETDFPAEETTVLTIGTQRPVETTVYLRYPSWSKEVKVAVNGKKVAVKQKPGSYIAITRLWKDGDRITADYPMRLRVETTPDNPQKGALVYGPELKFTTSQGDVIEPLYNIHRQRYVVYWDLEKE